MPEKKCPKCLEIKSTWEFSALSRGGYQSRCNACRREEMRQWREAHPELSREIQRKSWRKHRDRRLEDARKWSREHREHVNEYRRRINSYARYGHHTRTWMGRNRDKANEYTRRWYVNHPETAKAKNARNYAARRGAHNLRLTGSEWMNILNSWGHRCAYCGGMGATLTQDHVIPLVKGGQHIKENIVPACRSCNSRKRDKLIRPQMVADY